MSDFAARRAQFRKLHESGCFVIPNPWDAGSAKYLEHLGFRAVATTSSGYAFTAALPDHPAVLKREGVLANAAAIVNATTIPVNCDYQSGYAKSLDELAESVRLCVETGVAGLSIEDSTGDLSKPLFDIEEAVDRLSAARAAIDATGTGVMLCGRAECFLTGQSDALAESVKRIKAYADAGADVLFAPGVSGADGIRAIVDAAGGKPVNHIVFTNTGLSVSDYAEMGVRRISVGSALSRAAWSGFISAAKKLADGSFEGFEGIASFAELNGLFGG